LPYQIAAEILDLLAPRRANERDVKTCTLCSCKRDIWCWTYLESV